MTHLPSLRLQGQEERKGTKDDHVHLQQHHIAKKDEAKALLIYNSQGVAGFWRLAPCKVIPWRIRWPGWYTGTGKLQRWQSSPRKPPDPHPLCIHHLPNTWGNNGEIFSTFTGVLVLWRLATLKSKSCSPTWWCRCHWKLLPVKCSYSMHSCSRMAQTRTDSWCRKELQPVQQVKTRMIFKFLTWTPIAIASCDSKENTGRMENRADIGGVGASGPA